MISGTDSIPCFVIAGPTASGKSALALMLARAHDAFIVNADSMQVYDGLRIMTARPDEAELLQAEHRLYGHVDPARAYSVGEWAQEAKNELESADKMQRPVVFVGGTGLYFSALLRGLSEIPQPDTAIREYWRGVAQTSPERLHGELAKRDPAGANAIRPSDPLRLVRALETFDSTGLPIGHWQGAARQKPVISGRPMRKMLIMPAREKLNAAIEGRFDEMVSTGGLDEVEALYKRGLDPNLPAMKAIGVAQLLVYFRGECTLDAALEAGKAATRQYAKRQCTWFRHQLDEGWETTDESMNFKVG